MARREADRARDRAYYLANRERIIARVSARKATRRVPCKRCGADKGPGRRRQLCDSCRAQPLRQRRPCERCGGEKEPGMRRYCDACRPEAQREQNRRAHQTRAGRRVRNSGARVVERVDRLLVYARGGGLCGICGDAVSVTAFEVDHIVPLARGGEHSYANTQPAHPTCNRRKWAHVD